MLGESCNPDLGGFLVHLDHARDDASGHDRRWHAALAHRERLLTIARTRTASLEDAEDAVQEALLRCAEFEGLDEERLGRFLTSVTVRLCIDEHRRRSQASRLGRRLEAEPTVTTGSDEPVCDQLEAVWVASLVAGLPPRQREVLAAKADGLSCREIGGRYRMSYKAVESALTHARKTIRAALATTSCALAATLARAGWRSRSAAALAAVPVAAALVVGAYDLPGRWQHQSPPPGPVEHKEPDSHDIARIAGQAAAAPVATVPPATGPVFVEEARTDRPPFRVPSPSPDVDDNRPPGWTPESAIRECLRDGVTVEIRVYPDELGDDDNIRQHC